MAVAQVKPSRWTYFFFGGLLLVALVRWGWTRREQATFEHDAPVAHTARRLLRCMLGRDVQRLLDDRATAGGSPGVPSWTDKVQDRLQRIVATYAGDAWPARCVPIADRLASRLSTDIHAARAALAASRARELLGRGAERPVDLMAGVESGALAAALAAVAVEVSGLTSGTGEGWASPLPFGPTDLDPVSTINFPHAAAIAADADAPVLAMPDLLVYRGQGDGMIHRVTYDARERPTDRALGRGVPVATDDRDGALRVASDDGDALFLPDGEPAALLPVPEAARRGVESLDGWQVLLSQDALAWSSVTRGVARVRRTARSGEVHWSEPVVTVGRADEVVAAMLYPGANGAMRLATLERGADTVALATRAIAVDAGMGPSGVSAVGGDWITFDPQVHTCVAPHARYMLVSDAFALRVIALRDDGTTGVQDLRPNTLGVPLGRRFELRCSDSSALLFADFDLRTDALVLFAFRGEPRVLVPPVFGGHARITGAALTRDHVAVVVETDATVRAYRASVRDLIETAAGAMPPWSGGALLALRVASDASAMPPRERRWVEVLQFVAREEQVALLTRVTEGARVFLGRLSSRDSGASFRGD